jgi:excisionase family DNA binding protein
VRKKVVSAGLFKQKRSVAWFGRSIALGMHERTRPLTREETADLLNVSLRSVDRLCARGELRKGRAGGIVRIERVSVEGYLAKMFGRAETPALAAVDARDRWLPELAAKRAAKAAARPRPNELGRAA